MTDGADLLQRLNLLRAGRGLPPVERSSETDRLVLLSGVGPLFRRTRSNPPERLDFMSYEELGTPIRTENSRLILSSKGVSVYDDWATMKRKTRVLKDRPWVARLQIPSGTEILAYPDGHHYDLFVSPDGLLALVQVVVAFGEQ